MRRLWVLVQGLPAEAAAWRGEAWTMQEELLASHLELTDLRFRDLLQIHSKKRLRGKPLQVKRPGSQPARRQRQRLEKPEDVEALLGGPEKKRKKKRERR